MSARPWSEDDVVVLDGARTAIGAFQGALAELTATQLGVVAAQAAIARSGIEAEVIDAVFVGNVLQSDNDAVYLARHIGLDAGAPVGAPALTLNRLCASGLESVVQAARALRLGEAGFALAGGAESMSRVPHALRGVRAGWGLGRGQVDDVLWCALTDPKAGCQIGQTVEHLAAELGVTRAEADAFALEAHQRAAAAAERGRLAREIVPVEIPRGKATRRVERDECVRADVTAAGLAALRPLYGPEGVCTPGNASGLNDAAAMLLLTTLGRARAHGLRPLGRVLSWGTVGVEPLRMGLGPAPATRQALERAGLGLEDLDVIEINDAFAAQYLAVERALGLDRQRVNRNGGGLGLGHPMGATGARLALTALYELRERGATFALATLCAGGGQGLAVIFEAAP